MLYMDNTMAASELIYLEAQTFHTGVRKLSRSQSHLRKHYRMVYIAYVNESGNETNQEGCYCFMHNRCATDGSF